MLRRIGARGKNGIAEERKVYSVAGRDYFYRRQDT